MLQNYLKSKKYKKGKIQTMDSSLQMTKSHFMLEKLYPVNPKKNAKSYTIILAFLALIIT